MMNGRSGVLVALLFAMLLVSACAPGAPSLPASSDPGGQITQSAPTRTVVVATRREPSSLSTKMRQESGIIESKLPYNAALALVDEQEVATPYLAEALPQLNSETWRVFPDGRMETTYRLRPGLTWHDGVPLSAGDFAFAWRVYVTPGVDVTETLPQDLMDEVLAPEPRTVVIRWKRSYPQAGGLGSDFPPLPRHLLESAFQQESVESFLAQPYWTRDYVGLGPYRLDRWEPGTFTEGAAFAGHVLGRPKIDRIRVLVMPDPNTVVASLLSGAVHMATDGTISVQQGNVLQQEWGRTQGGIVLVEPGEPRSYHVQFRPELTNPHALLDVRVRRALEHAIDRKEFADAIHEGQGVPAESIVPVRSQWYPAVDRIISKYPYDLRQSEQLMREAGFTKGSDGVYVSPTEGRFALEPRSDAGARNEQEVTILAEGWRRAGFDAAESIFPTALLRDREWHVSFPSVLRGGPVRMLALTSAATPRRENSWTGGNRGSWFNADYNRFAEAFNTTLDAGERAQQVVQMAKLVSDELPVLHLYHDIAVDAHVADLQGPRQGGNTLNTHEWQ